MINSSSARTNAKRAVAIALRNRWRRQQVPEDLRDEIAPKNIIMMGPTGVGKTEIARRLAKLAQSPFLKIEASKFTEVGYVGRDVESMIRDLTELAVNQVKAEEAEKVQAKAREIAEERMLDLLLPPSPKKPHPQASSRLSAKKPAGNPGLKRSRHLQPGRSCAACCATESLTSGKSSWRPPSRTSRWLKFFPPPAWRRWISTSRTCSATCFPKRRARRKVKVPEALEIITREEAQKLVDMDLVTRQAIERVEQSGIIFLDEIDKIAGREHAQGPDVSREGVQRDLLPIVEGSTVTTKYGMVKTDHILFIASGAFYVSKPSDLIPELQGRFPIRVELNSLSREDFIRILTEPQNALLKQYSALMETENVKLVFKQDAIERIAEIATTVNERTENIGARRLHTIMEKLLEDYSFEAPEMKGKKIILDAAYVTQKMEPLLKDEDLSRYIL